MKTSMFNRHKNKMLFAIVVLLFMFLSVISPVEGRAEEGSITAIELSEPSVEIKIGGTKQLTVVVKNQFGNEMSGEAVTWSSSDPNIAIVDNNGLVTAVGVGMVAITAASVSKEDVKAECQVKVINDYLTNLVIISGTDGFMAPVVEAYHNLTEKRNPAYLFGLKVFSPWALDSTEGKAKVQEAVLNADAVLLEMIGANRDAALHDIFSACYESTWKDEGQPEIFAQRSGEKNKDGTWANNGFAVEIVKDLEVTINKDDEAWTQLNKYILNSGVNNWERLLLYLAANYGDGDVVTGENLNPIEFGGAFLYHPAADVNWAVYEGNENGTLKNDTGIFFNQDNYFTWYTARGSYNPDAPWVGIVGYDSFFKNADHEMYVETLLALEKRGLNAILLYPPSKRIDPVKNFFYRDLNGDGQKEPAIDVFICATGFQFERGSDTNTLALFKEMDIPVLTPIYSSDLNKWYSDSAGAMKEINWQVALPELEGRIEPVLMGGTVIQGIDEATGAVVSKKVAIEDRIERFVGRAEAWAKLHRAANEDKKVAIVYYNLHGGKDGIGASYLNVPRSLTEMLKAMKNAGYKVDEDNLLTDDSGQIAEDKVFEAMFSKGRNIGGWAPGELQAFTEQDGIIKLSLDTYLQWYNELPAGVREKVEADWGPPPGKIMVYNGEIIIPGIISGNVFLGPQPMRGWGEDISKIIHSPTLPPPHQYLAFYFWLQHGFKADAVIHLGTHGTAEWLPGKAVGLSGEDWPDIVQGNMPNIYPYIVNNPGEATQAKRRGYAVIIDHLTATVANTELYGNLLELHDLSHQYELAADPANNQPPEEVEKLQAKIMRILKEEGVANEMGLDPDYTPFAELLKAAHEYLDALQADVTPLGLHTFGVAPQGELFEQMVQAIINYDKANRTADEAKIRENLGKTTEEMDMLLCALSAGYIPPGLGKDPVRNPDVMPTGRNIKSFDPRTVPDKGAWEIGKKCADDLLAAYYAEHGSYPESIGAILWAIETMRTEGQSIAMVMRLMGIEPVWDANGNVKSYNISPVSDLGRPRIDVVVNISGLFRDTFTVVSELLDKAIRELALLDEKPEDNYLKKHYDSLKEELISQGKAEDEAAFLAGSRVFGEPPGAYGIGLSNMMDATAQWNTNADLAEVYIGRMSYIYGSPKSDGSPVYGVADKELLVSVLKNVQAVVQVRDSIYGALDNDDVAQYLGGLVLASKWASGRDVDAYIANTRLGSSNLKIQTFEQFVAQELHSRLLNPKFIEEMLKEGYSGASTIAKWIGNTFYVDATTGAIDNWAWHEIANKYVFDEQVRSQLDPYALQSLIAYTTEAARKGLWEASNEDLTQLSNVYMQTMVDYGVVCCHHTCNNIVFNEWLARFSTLDNNMRSEFEQKLAVATERPVNIPRLENRSNDREDPPKEQETEMKPAKPDKTIEPLQPATPNPVPKDVSVDVQAVPAATPPVAGNEAAVPEPVAQVASAAGNVAPSAPEAKAVKPETNQAGNQNEAKAYEITPVEKTKKAFNPQGVTIWAVLGAVAGTGVLMLGFFKKG